MTSNAEESLATLLRWEKITGWEREFRFSERRWRFDFAWPLMAKVGPIRLLPKRVAVEVDGGSFIAGRHTRGTGFEADLEKLNTAALLGWTVLRVTPKMIEDGHAENMRAAVAIARDVDLLRDLYPEPDDG